MLKKILLFVVFMVAFKCVDLRASTFKVVQKMSFGTLMFNNSSGSANISLAGNITTSAGASVVTKGPLYHQGILKIANLTPVLNRTSEVVKVTVLDNQVTLNNIKGNGTLMVDNFVVDNIVNALPNTTGTDVRVGGQLNSLNVAEGGTYVGTVRIKVEKNSYTQEVSLPIEVVVFGALYVRSIKNLSFGVMEKLTGKTIVRINPQNGIRSIVFGNGVNLLSGSPFASAGTFISFGEPNTTLNVSFSRKNVRLLSGNNNIKVSNFTTYPRGGELVLNGWGYLNIKVGADLIVRKNQPSGSYTGTYNLVVNY